MATTNIQPFAFERIFLQSAARTEARSEPHTLQSEIDGLRAQLERIELEREAALAEARNEGYEAGLAHARSEREAAMLAAVDALQAGVEQISEEVDTAVARTTAEAAELALAAADLIAARALEAAPTAAIDAALGRLLGELGRNPNLVISVHTDLVEEMERLVAGRQEGERRRMFLHVVADETMAVGDALITWQEGGLRLDAEARRQAVREELDGLLG